MSEVHCIWTIWVGKQFCIGVFEFNISENVFGTSSVKKRTQVSYWSLFFHALRYVSLTSCIFSKSRQGLCKWCIRLCLYRFFDPIVRRSRRSSGWDRNSWKAGRTTSAEGVSLRDITTKGGLVDRRGLCTWLGGVVENSTGVVGSTGDKVAAGEADDELLEFGMRAGVGRWMLLISSNSSSDEWLPPSISRVWHEKMEGVPASFTSLWTSSVNEPSVQRGVLEGRVGRNGATWPPSSSVRSMVSEIHFSLVQKSEGFCVWHRSFFVCTQKRDMLSKPCIDKVSNKSLFFLQCAVTLKAGPTRSKA